MTFEQECEKRVKDIAKEIEALCDKDDYDRLSEYLDDVFDIEYRIDQQKEYRSVCFAVAIGGPGIYVDTDDSYVKLYWGSTRTKAPLSYAASEKLDDYFSELWSCL